MPAIQISLLLHVYLFTLQDSINYSIPYENTGGQRPVFHKVMMLLLSRLTNVMRIQIECKQPRPWVLVLLVSRRCFQKRVNILENIIPWIQDMTKICLNINTLMFGILKKCFLGLFNVHRTWRYLSDLCVHKRENYNQPHFVQRTIKMHNNMFTFATILPVNIYIDR